MNFINAMRKAGKAGAKAIYRKNPYDKRDLFIKVPNLEELENKWSDYCRSIDIDEDYESYANMPTFDEWIEDNLWTIEADLNYYKIYDGEVSLNKLLYADLLARDWEILHNERLSQ